ncbi:hypothetical protein TRSC58_07436 [Trypanosoma rangeli SC58]|uniref:Uncharacterized protein n=1 Tax=Trypanosoma rangeli SC58 TaxID=429131 RepID=A0A061IRZ7_TRYRA|nr:hypothetical protein TRSC58_07436 [Trypanosoma rangeli SC58]
MHVVALLRGVVSVTKLYSETCTPCLFVHDGKKKKVIKLPSPLTKKAFIPPPLSSVILLISHTFLAQTFTSSPLFSFLREHPHPRCPPPPFPFK